jgi:hypothetical protein
VDPSAWVILSTGILAALVALIGYLLSQLANRNDRKIRLYAEALTAVHEYEELPYRIRRRTSNLQSGAAVAERVDDVLTKVLFHRAWLQLDSEVVGIAFQDLVAQTGKQGGPYRAEAWSKPAVASDGDFDVRDRYIFDNEPELRLCLLAMRRDLLLRNLFLRGSTKRLLAEQRRKREAHDVDETA